MAKKKPFQSVIRPGAQRAEVYNEALCVYLHDEGWTEKLREMLASEEYGEAHDGQTFYENLCDPEFAAAVVKAGMAFTYCLQQDDEIVMEAALGPPLSEEELKAACWLPLQHYWLDLPTGRLRIDTANTMPLDPEDHEDEGAVLSFPPGKYAATLYRVDWDEMGRQSRKKYQGPQEFLVLTPSDERPENASLTPVLDFLQHPDLREWVGAWSVDGKSFTGRITSFGFWEGFNLNLDRAAAGKLGLEVGSVLVLKFDEHRCDLIFLGDWSWEDYRTQFGKAKLEAAFAERKEGAVGSWRKFGDDEILSCYRFKSTKAHPEKLQGVWTAVEGEVKAEMFAPPEPVVVQPAVFLGDRIDAGVVFLDDVALAVNVDESMLRRLGGDEGSLLRLELADGVYSVHLGKFGEPWGRALLENCDWEPRVWAMYVRIQTKFFQREGSKVVLGEGATAVVLPAGERRPLTGSFAPQSPTPTSGLLHLQPMYVDGNSAPFDWPAPPEVGDRCTLRLASPTGG